MEKLRFAGEFDPWEEKKLGEVLVNFNKKTNKNNEFPVISSTRTGIYLQEDYFTKQVASADNKGYKIVPRGYATYRSMSDTTDFTFNIQDIVETAIVSPAYPVFTTVNGISLEYLIEVMNHSHIFKNNITKSLQGGTRSALPFSRLADLSVNLPSFPEQEKIGGFLSALDEEIECQSKLVDLLALEYKGYSQRIFSQQLRFKDENGEDCPEWEEKKLGEVLSVTPISKFQILSSEIEKEGKFQVVDQGKKLVTGYHDDDSKLFTDTPVIVYGDHTTSVKYREEPFIVGGDGVKLIKSDIYNNEYLFHSIVNYNVNSEGYRRHYPLLKEVYVPLPSLPEQKKIGAFLSSLYERLETEQELLIQLRDQKKAYLQKLFP